MNQLSLVSYPPQTIISKQSLEIASWPPNEIASMQRSWSLTVACCEQMQLATQKLHEQMQLREEENRTMIQASQARISSSTQLIAQAQENEKTHAEQTKKSIGSIQETQSNTQGLLQSTLEHKQNQLNSLNRTLESVKNKISEQDQEILRLKSAISNLH